MSIEETALAMLEAEQATAVPVSPEAAPSADATTETTESELARLAMLSPVDYDRERKGAAKALGIRGPTLDKAVQMRRQDAAELSGQSFEYPTVEPWPNPVDGAELLSSIRDTVRRFIVCEETTANAAALWCAFTWFIDAVQVAPLAIITAPEKRCGKSQLLDLMRRLSRKTLAASNITGSALFRVIERDAPTLFIDEADSFMRQNEDLRGIINSGHTRSSAFVLRTVGENFDPKSFSTWGAKAIAGIGALPETIMDRGIILELRRKLPTESIERLRHADPNAFPCLASKLARWSGDYENTVRGARPSLPEALNDREQDSWEPLLAIAECAGGDWPGLAREAALALSKRNAENTVSTGAELLADIREVFREKNVDRLSSKDLLAALTGDEEKSWHTYNRGQPMTPKQLAKRLRGYEILSGTVRTWSGTPKGYKLEQFSEAFARYLEPKTEQGDEEVEG